MEEKNDVVFWEEENVHIQKWDNRPYVKNLGQVAAVILGTQPPPTYTILWYNTSTHKMLYYNRSVGDWLRIDSAYIEGRNIGGGQGQFFKENIEGVEGNATMFYRTLKSEIPRINITTIDDEIIIGDVIFTVVDDNNVCILDSSNTLIIY